MDNPQTGQFTQMDPIGLAGGLNAYGFAAGDPVSFADPYGLKADSVYNQKGEAIGDKGGASQHYLVYNGNEYQLDRKIVPNDAGTPYAVYPDGAADVVAMAMANAETDRSRLTAAWDSRGGGDLDFKRKEPLRYPRQLFIIGNRAVHTDVVGNMAWGYYVRTQLDLSERDARRMAKRAALGNDDPNDLWGIARAYRLPVPTKE